MASGIRVNEAGDRLRVFESIDFSTQQGREIKSWLEATLDDLRRKNDATQGEVETAHLRGQIAFVKTMLKVAPPMVTVPRFDNMTPRRG